MDRADHGAPAANCQCGWARSPHGCRSRRRPPRGVGARSAAGLVDQSGGRPGAPGDRWRTHRRRPRSVAGRARSRPDAGGTRPVRGGRGPRRGLAGPHRDRRGPAGRRGRARRSGCRAGRGRGGVGRRGQGVGRTRRGDRACEATRRRSGRAGQPVQGVVERDDRTARQDRGRPRRGPAQGDRAAHGARPAEPRRVQRPADRGGEGAGADEHRPARSRPGGAADRRDSAAGDRRIDDGPAEAADPWLLGRDPAPTGGRDGRDALPMRFRSSAHHARRAPCAPAGHARQSGRGAAHLRGLQGAPERLFGRHGHRGRAAPRRTPREVREERAHARRAAVGQAVLEGAGHARVRRLVPAQRGLLRRRLGARARPLRLRGGARRRAGHPQHADRHAAGGRLRVEAGGIGRECGRGVPARAGAARQTWPHGQQAGQARRALRSSVNAYNESIATVEGTVLVRARRFRDLNVSERELVSPTPIEEPVRQIQAPELVEDAVAVDTILDRRVGRGRRRRSPIPERDELVRPDPDLLELVGDSEPTDNDERRTS